jgi:hypothetical protein
MTVDEIVRLVFLVAWAGSLVVIGTAWVVWFVVRWWKR